MPSRLYGIAGRQLVSDLSMAELEAFRLLGDHRIDLKVTDNSQFSGPTQVVFRGPAELGPRRFELECIAGEGGLELSVADHGRFVIDRRGGRITFVRGPQAEEPSAVSELVLGPALSLALALQNVWSLHASAVETGGRALAFLGVSGIGKSTLAHELPAVSNGYCRCVADDVLPITLAADGVQALPRFPQLKYPPDRQPGAGVPASLPLVGIYLLTPRTSGAVTVEPVNGYAAVLALVRHTHCTRLFPQELLRRHFDFCSRLVSAVPVWRLSYPKRRSIWPDVEAALRSAHKPGSAARVRGGMGVAAADDHLEWSFSSQSPSRQGHLSRV